MKVVWIKPDDTYPIRHQVLREGYPIESCYFAGDHDEKTFHLGAIVDKKLVSVASFYFDPSPHFSDPYQYRLRGMATLPEQRNQGFSRSLLQTAIPVIRQNQGTLLWCNARFQAVGFYESTGLQKLGNIFEIEGIGPHQLMYIRL
jgi:predicted GNAT family N-acyltransferase